MKSKIILLVAGAALATLSFTFASTSHSEKKEVAVTTEQLSSNAPAGGFALEEK